MADFERKIKYVVLKIDDIEQALSPQDHLLLCALMSRIERYREKLGKPREIEAVVIKSDMACYDAAWKLVEDEVNGKV